MQLMCRKNRLPQMKAVDGNGSILLIPNYSSLPSVAPQRASSYPRPSLPTLPLYSSMAWHRKSPRPPTNSFYRLTRSRSSLTASSVPSPTTSTCFKRRTISRSVCKNGAGGRHMERHETDNRKRREENAAKRAAVEAKKVHDYVVKHNLTRFKSVKLKVREPAAESSSALPSGTKRTSEAVENPTERKPVRVKIPRLAPPETLILSPSRKINSSTAAGPSRTHTCTTPSADSLRIPAPAFLSPPKKPRPKPRPVVRVKGGTTT
ncbi:hypothetical protein OF83DRAFT_659807 [Amylostereum chailletii]|nr:hypothetical protein OF83DRAFT_659807 [Amylostereum chailletii]